MRLRLRHGALSAHGPADVCPLLPLHELPDRNRQRLVINALVEP